VCLLVPVNHGTVVKYAIGKNTITLTVIRYAAKHCLYAYVLYAYGGVYQSSYFCCVHSV
jgi:hypothetical protein